jgi:hypothetical protein
MAGLPSFMALRHGGDVAFDKKGVTTEWMSPQFSSSIPNTCKKTPRHLMKFLKRLWVSVKNNIVPLSKESRKRSEMVAAMVRCIRSSCSGKECEDSLKFVAGQIVADMEEIFCGDNMENSPFVDDEIVTGYGGKEGFSVFCSETDCVENPTRKRGKKPWKVDTDCQDQLRNVCLEILRYIEKELSDEDLKQLGLIRINGKGDTYVAVVLSGRRITTFDVEHMMCKIYLAVAAYRGSRSFSVPTPWRPHCHPTASPDVFTNPAVAQIFNDAIFSFESELKKGSLDALVEPFLFKHELTKQL